MFIHKRDNDTIGFLHTIAFIFTDVVYSIGVLSVGDFVALLELMFRFCLFLRPGLFVLGFRGFLFIVGKELIVITKESMGGSDCYTASLGNAIDFVGVFFKVEQGIPDALDIAIAYLLVSEVPK